jgi:hypothetical protein
VSFHLDLYEDRDGLIIWPALYLCSYEDEQSVDGRRISQLQLGWLYYTVALTWN